MDRIQFEDLLNKYLLEKITRKETIQFFNMLEEPGYEKLLKEHIGKDFKDDTYDEREDLVRRERIKVKLAALTKKNKTTPLFTIRRMVAAAAVIILCLGVGGYIYFNNKAVHSQQSTDHSMIANDIKAPLSNKAMITLANGKQIILDSAGNGTLAKEGDVNISKLADGQIAYTALRQAQGDMQYNTLSNPRGSKVINLTLSDGSKVWLNAESSLKYPTAFSGNERKVEITGEAYFEVAHNVKMPFTVLANGTEIHDIGTAFNVNTYSDEEKMKVTLVEGSVKDALRQAQGDNVILKPGQQAILRQAQDDIQVIAADVDEAIAWKNGMFSFKGADIQTVMRQVARWYDVEVVFEGKIPSKHYNGETSRNLNASQMLKVLEESGIRFRIEGKKIIVTN